MAEVRLEHVTKAFAKGASVIQDLTLHVRDHEFLVLVGPSGCGKSTVLRMIAGLEAVTEGDLYIGSRRANDVPPKDRDVAMVFQNYALYPHMTVYDNLAFSLRNRHMNRAEIERRVQKAAQMLGLAEYLRRRPRQLSGGQRQRVALGRALVRDPQVFLLDEPLSNLDAKLRVQTRTEIARLHQATGTTFIYVTHDQVEAMTMGDRIAVLNAGAIQQLGSPQELYDCPANLFVAGFIGSPSINLFEATLVRQPGGDAALVVGSETQPMVLALTGQAAAQVTGHATAAGQRVVAGIRPEDLHLAPVGQPNTINGVVDVVEHLGNEQLVYLRVAGALSPDATEAATSIARLPAGTQVEIGQPMTLAVNTDKLHVFDAETGQRYV